MSRGFSLDVTISLYRFNFFCYGTKKWYSPLEIPTIILYHHSSKRTRITSISYSRGRMWDVLKSKWCTHLHKFQRCSWRYSWVKRPKHSSWLEKLSLQYSYMNHYLPGDGTYPNDSRNLDNIHVHIFQITHVILTVVTINFIIMVTHCIRPAS